VAGIKDHKNCWEGRNTPNHSMNPLVTLQANKGRSQECITTREYSQSELHHWSIATSSFKLPPILVKMTRNLGVARTRHSQRSSGKRNDSKGWMDHPISWEITKLKGKQWTWCKSQQGLEWSINHDKRCVKTRGIIKWCQKEGLLKQKMLSNAKSLGRNWQVSRAYWWRKIGSALFPQPRRIGKALPRREKTAMSSREGHY